ncbi:MAG TPA: aspartate aminotransferase family protein [Bryobacteraceae bacterium]|jgi:4-aminobutyrate aminotransferase/diaminobutyrate-pyruvate transaminase/4-aminobutyrate aminotransferase/(S)-3-amino-2-methylpropionate transaminase|nr:aspartate aminotransferase family protein [Bryobacteraceae bacterium]
MAREFDLAPKAMPPIQTRFRRIATQLPVPETLPILESLHRYEPLAMRGQPPVVWDKAVGFQVYDAYGNCWIDWSSGVLITNAGHGRQQIINAIVDQASSGLLTNYGFASEIRSRLVKELAGLLPWPLKKIFLLTTGSETVECAIKLARSHGLRTGGAAKNIIVSFSDAFHGRTLGAQQAGGIPALKEWILNLDPGFAQVPFPDGFRTRDTSFDYFERCLRDQHIDPDNVAAVLLETYQGASAAFAPAEYMRSLRQWCNHHRALLILDEVQGGFGRTGTMWGFEHYGIVPDLALFGKGISSSLPIAAVAGSAEIMDSQPIGTMTSTHTGNPVCCAAALASIDLVVNEKLAANACQVGNVLHRRLRELQSRFPQVGAVQGRGLVAGLSCVAPGSTAPDADLAWNIVRLCFEKGVLMFAPVGFGGATVKIAPPLVITEEAILESAAVLEEAFDETIGDR